MEAVAAYLEEGSEHPDRWNAVTAHLLASPGGLLATALSTPLMAWLTRVIYRQSDTAPDEMLTASWSRDRHSLEEHLLSRLIPAVYGQNIARYRRRSMEQASRAKRYLANLAYFNDIHQSYDLDWRQLRDGIPKRMFGVVFGVAGIFVIGLAVGVVAILGNRIWIGLALLFASGLILGLIFGLGEELVFIPYRLRSEPANKRPTIGPDELLRRYRKYALVLILIFGILIGLITTLEHAQFKSGSLMLLFDAFLVAILVYLLLGNEWILYMITRLLMAIIGVTPLRLMTFLREARIRGILRQEGPVYQFRHVRLQDYLRTLTLLPASERVIEDDRSNKANYLHIPWGNQIIARRNFVRQDRVAIWNISTSAHAEPGVSPPAEATG
jgi:hypothetical protein